MPELWTFSGINSWDEARQDYVHYVGEAIDRQVDQDSARRYVSRLGTTRHYQGRASLLTLDSQAKLDREARRFASGRIEAELKIAPGELRTSEIRVMLVAPKTTTQPPPSCRDAFDLQVYWSPDDRVPSQRLFGPDTLTYWRRWGRVWPVRNPRGHALSGFLRDGMRVVKRVRRRRTRPRRGGQPTSYQYVWQTTTQPVPSPQETIGDWLADGAIDVVIVGHSQGANIAMHVLRRGWAS